MEKWTTPLLENSASQSVETKSFVKERNRNEDEVLSRSGSDAVEGYRDESQANACSNLIVGVGGVPCEPTSNGKADGRKEQDEESRPSHDVGEEKQSRNDKLEECAVAVGNSIYLKADEQKLQQNSKHGKDDVDAHVNQYDDDGKHARDVCNNRQGRENSSHHTTGSKLRAVDGMFGSDTHQDGKDWKDAVFGTRGDTSSNLNGIGPRSELYPNGWDVERYPFDNKLREPVQFAYEPLSDDTQGKSGLTGRVPPEARTIRSSSKSYGEGLLHMLSRTVMSGDTPASQGTDESSAKGSVHDKASDSPRAAETRARIQQLLSMDYSSLSSMPQLPSRRGPLTIASPRGSPLQQTHRSSASGVVDGEARRLSFREFEEDKSCQGDDGWSVESIASYDENEMSANEAEEKLMRQLEEDDGLANRGEDWLFTIAVFAVSILTACVFIYMICRLLLPWLARLEDS